MKNFIDKNNGNKNTTTFLGLKNRPLTDDEKNAIIEKHKDIDMRLSHYREITKKS